MKPTEHAIASKIRFDDSDEELESSASEEENELEKALADVTFEELLRARSDGSDMVNRKRNFEKKAGRVNKNRFRKRYNFIYESALPAEKEELKKQMKKANNPEVKDEIKDHMAQIDKELKKAVMKRTEKDILAEHKKKQRVAAKQGKKPYYLKKSDVKKQTLIEKFKELKESGKLESFMEKKRKKNAAKDHRYVPYRRPADQ